MLMSYTINGGIMKEKQKIELRIQKAIYMHETIGLFIDGRITILEASISLNCHKNYIYQLRDKWEKDNNLCYISKKIGVSINKKATQAVRDYIVDQFRLYCIKLEENPITVQGRNMGWFTRPTYQSFYEHIEKDIPVKLTVVTEILKANNLLSSRSRNKKSHNKIVSVTNEENFKQHGEEMQLDGKVGIKFPDDKFTCVAHSAVDAGSNCILGMFFDKQETNFGYLSLTKKVLYKYGYSPILVTDCRSSFTTNLEIGDKNVIIAKGFADLITELVTSSNPKRKGKVESKNDTIQIRILQELAYAGVRTMEQANNIIDEVVGYVNDKLNNNISDQNMFIKLPANFDFDRSFASVYERSTNQYSKIQFNNEEYFAINNENIKHFKNKTKVQIIQTYQGKLTLECAGTSYDLVIANQAAKNKYQIEYIFKKHISFRTQRTDFCFKSERYHIVDNLQNAVTIPKGAHLTKYYDETGTILYVKLNKTKYLVKKGVAPVDTEITKIITKKIVVIKYDSTFKFQNKTYAITLDGIQVVFDEGARIEITLENNIPAYLVHKKKIMHFRDISLSVLGLKIPVSHYQAKMYWESNPHIHYIIS